MISIQLTTDNEVINKILENPLIYQMVNGTSLDETLIGSYREELKNNGFKFLGIYSHNSLIGLFSYREISKICIEAHIHILPEAHKKGYGKQAVKEGLEYFSGLGAHKIVTYVPSNCLHVLKFMKDNDFEVSGSVSEAIIYNNELVSVFVFSKGL